MKLRKRTILLITFILAVVAAIGATAWYKLLREAPQEVITNDEEWFKYGSIGGEGELGIPYWIWLVAPRIFPELVNQAGGYRAFGVAWEPGREMPIGFIKKTIGFPRVGNNCALCHVASYRKNESDNPTYVTGAPSNTLNVQRMLRFFVKAANDPRFDADIIIPEIKREIDLSTLDEALYRFLIIPLTRKAFQEQGKILQFSDEQPDWGPGRDDSFNLPKYFLANMPNDHSCGQCDFGPAWNLDERRGKGLFLNWGGETQDVTSIFVDSAVGAGARPNAQFENDMRRLDHFLSKLPPAPWPAADSGPYVINKKLAADGKNIYDSNCAICHEPGREKFARVTPIAEIGTDPERYKVWTKEAAGKMNDVINNKFGAKRPDVIKNTEGYLAGPLGGIWIRAPYLHNGSVPNLRELLEPENKRSTEFYRGYDVYDPVNVGFVSSGERAARAGFKLDTTKRGNSNVGHLYGTTLPDGDKKALLEYLKTK